MPIFTHRYIKDKADELLDRFGMVHPPVDVRRMAKGLNLEIIEMTQDTWFFGMLLRFHDDCYIIVNKLLPEPKRRFAVAHEIGHYQLHSDNMKYSERKEKEYLHREANIFAAELLMPIKMIRRQAKEWHNDHKMLAEIFGTTEAAMVEKLKELGIVNKERYNWNYLNVGRV